MTKKPDLLDDIECALENPNFFAEIIAINPDWKIADKEFENVRNGLNPDGTPRLDLDEVLVTISPANKRPA
jgi:hypothetical protein